MDKLLWLILWIWGFIGAVVSLIVFILTWVVIAAIFFGIWHIFGSGTI